jgi:hypothetical protein
VLISTVYRLWFDASADRSSSAKRTSMSSSSIALAEWSSTLSAARTRVAAGVEGSTISLSCVETAAPVACWSRATDCLLHSATRFPIGRLKLGLLLPRHEGSNRYATARAASSTFPFVSSAATAWSIFWLNWVPCPLTWIHLCSRIRYCATEAPCCARQGEVGKKASQGKKATKGAKAAKPAKREAGLREGSKTEKVLELLKRPDGTTLKEIMKATGRPTAVQYLLGPSGAGVLQSRPEHLPSEISLIWRGNSNLALSAVSPIGNSAGYRGDTLGNPV